MFKRNGGRRFHGFSRSRRSETDVMDDQDKHYAVAESPVIKGRSGFLAASTEGAGKNMIQGHEDVYSWKGRSSHSGVDWEKSGPSASHQYTPPTSSTQPELKQHPSKCLPQRIDSLPSSPPTRDESRALELLRDHEEIDENADTDATSIEISAPLQTKGFSDPNDPIDVFNEDDPSSYDIVNLPPDDENTSGGYSLEIRSEQIFSKEHLKAIFKDPTQLIKFSAFLGKHKQECVPMLLYYLDSLKALETINYSNAVAEMLSPLPGFEFTKSTVPKTVNAQLEEKANLAFEALTRDALSAYVTHVFTQIVSSTVKRRITGTLPTHLRETSNGLAEVFCLSDPSRRDNPLVLASAEFHRCTQYGVDFAMGRNCRFLQGPRTSRDSVRRIREAIASESHHSETFLNYRRDGSPFLNLLMVAPLCDNRGRLRYFLGAQIDVSGLAKECVELEALKHMLAAKHHKFEQSARKQTRSPTERARDSLKDLSEMFSATELATIRDSGGRMNRRAVDSNQYQNRTDAAAAQNRPRLVLKEPSSGDDQTQMSRLKNNVHSKLKGVYQHYLLVRPYPSLRILFASPSLRFPGILQSPFMNRIGSTDRVKNDLLAALEEGRGVTAKVKWLTATPAAVAQSQVSNQTRQQDSPRAGQIEKNRWIYCTPLLSSTGEVGVWMILLVDDELTARKSNASKPKQAPPVASPAALTGGLMSAERQRQAGDEVKNFGLEGNHSTELVSCDDNDEIENAEMEYLSTAGGSSIDGADFRVI